MSYTAILIALTVLAFVLQSDAAVIAFALWPWQGPFAPWQFISYAFLHGSLTHLSFNMLGLWMFGRELEHELGSNRFMKLYFASVLSAGLIQFVVATLSDGMRPTVGASGGVFGLLLAYGMTFPHRTVVPLIPPIPMPAWLFVALYALLELVLGVTGTQAGVAHFAHLGGMVGGWLVLRRMRRRP